MAVQRVSLSIFEFCKRFMAIQFFMGTVMSFKIFFLFKFADEDIAEATATATDSTSVSGKHINCFQGNCFVS